MNEPLGEFGGVVTREVKLFGDKYVVGDKLPAELLMQVSQRHRVALKGAGLVQYYSEPEGQSAFSGTTKVTMTTPPKRKGTTKRAPKKKASTSRRK